MDMWKAVGFTALYAVGWLLFAAAAKLRFVDRVTHMEDVAYWVLGVVTLFFAGVAVARQRGELTPYLRPRAWLLRLWLASSALASFVFGLGVTVVCVAAFLSKDRPQSVALPVFLGLIAVVGIAVLVYGVKQAGVALGPPERLFTARLEVSGERIEARAAGDGVAKATVEQVRHATKALRFVNGVVGLAVLFWISFFALGGIPREGSSSVLGTSLAMLGILVTTVVLVLGTYRLARSIDSGAPLLWAILSPLGCVGIVFVAVLCSEATKWLTKQGLKVGLLGPSAASLAAFEEAHRQASTGR